MYLVLDIKKVSKRESLPSGPHSTLSILVVSRIHIEHSDNPKSSNGLCWHSRQERYKNLSLKYNEIKYKTQVIYKVWQLYKGNTIYLIVIIRSKGEVIF